MYEVNSRPADGLVTVISRNSVGHLQKASKLANKCIASDNAHRTIVIDAIWYQA